MRLYPAIDIRDGRCVRLSQGRFDKAKVYSGTPADMAGLWVSKGASYLHLVDLDGALAGEPVNEEAVRKVLECVEVPVQLGGGIRSRETAERMLKLGVSRVIIGTRAAEDPGAVRELVREFGSERIVVGVDAKNGMVAVEGWETVSAIPALDLVMKMKEYGVRHIIYTDISRDGMLSGPNVEATRILTVKSGIDIIASGGVSCMEDLTALHQAGISGVVIGKALYEGRVDFEKAAERFENSR